jgi:oligoribonuclease NrnB/cAMP/cGMP phosphodiesterase (DHH superfamily)
MKCFYHSVDLDGKCSGAIVKRKYPQCELFPINYGQPFPMNKIKEGEEVFLVDYSIQPFDLMIDLKNKANLIWIDHHSSAISESVFWKFQDTNGRRDVRLAACELVWHYIYNDKTIPVGVTLLGRYDVWDLTNKNAMPFQYGMRTFKSEPTDEVWKNVFSNDIEFIDYVTLKGSGILEYLKIDNSEYLNAYCFDSIIDGYNCICINRGKTSSQIFDSKWDANKYDLMVTFCRLPSQQWTVSMYTTKKNINVGRLAKKFGGGGHTKAAGFQCKDLPFEF